MGTISDGHTIIQFGNVNSTFSTGATFPMARPSFCRASGSFLEKIEGGISSIFGPSAYFDVLKSRVGKEVGENIISIASGVPITTDQLEKATLSKGFQRLNANLNEKGYTAHLQPYPHVTVPHYLQLVIQKQPTQEIQ